ncbi:hypothetical protein RchiOBHm_Chr6g0253751 [Rosa chinensis]|uniref:Epidermal patterning factor-like protein n=1 Tax=Rosa chinensis TaxID=74649 RepID=A0A2P6PLG8_ROSCH|nr:hypothetical protein RchiOBHm_Chr6g0253751 [Rosa chinensis]
MKMHREANSRTLILVLFLALLICSGSVHSCDFSSSPSPSPALGMPTPHEPSKGIFKKKRRGSFPATCYSKCNQCEPCMPVQVSVRAMELEENEYYPLVWKCACGDNIFSP